MRRIKIHRIVFYPTVCIVLVFWIGYMSNPISFDQTLEKVNQFINQSFGWFYLLAALFLVLVSAAVLFSGFGKVKIGGENARPMLTTMNWFTIVLCTTIAAGLIFWGASEPVFHLMEPPSFLKIEPGTHEAAVFSMTSMLLHWTITPYAIYSIPALMFAVAVYNQSKPFSFSSCVSQVIPKIGENVYSAVIDALCVFSMVMGMIASLGQGILSIAGGIAEVTGKQSGKLVWVMIGILITIIFTISACSGVLKGIKWISNINTIFLIGLLVFVFVAGPTMYMIQISLEAFGMYLDNFFTRSLMIGAGSDSDWSYYWTIASFANWMAWAPVTGMFLGKIAYGHSVRKFIAINLGAAAFSSGLWISVFGGTAIYEQMRGIDIYVGMKQSGAEGAVYEILKAIPLGAKLIPVLVVAVFLSVVTASDSATNVLGNLCCLGDEREPGMMTMKIVWGVLIGGMSIMLICRQGIKGVKMMSVIGGLPAAVLLVITGIGLLKTIVEYRKNKKRIFGKNP